MNNKLFYSIKEVSQILGVRDYTLRYWEKEFRQVKPKRSGGGRRLYTPDDIKLLKRIKTMLYDNGMTIEGVKRALKEKKVSPVTISQIKEELVSILKLLEDKSL
ncbi:MAG: MerR family transcriptional regulator [bacterium]